MTKSIEVWSICKLHQICLKNISLYANKFQALQEKENLFESLDHQSCIGHTEALAVVLAGSILMNVNIMWFGVRGMRWEQFDALFGS